MEYVLSAVLFIMLVAGIYSVCTQSEEDTDKNEIPTSPKVHSDETPTGTA